MANFVIAVRLHSQDIEKDPGFEVLSWIFTELWAKWQANKPATDLNLLAFSDPPSPCLDETEILPNLCLH